MTKNSNIIYEYTQPKPVLACAVLKQLEYHSIRIKRSTTENSIIIEDVDQSDGCLFIAKDHLEEFILALRAVNAGRAA